MDTDKTVVIAVVLLVGFGPAGVGTRVRAAGGPMGEVSFRDRYDRDGDGKYSAFTVSISADTRVGQFGDPSANPYFEIYVNGQLVRTTAVVSTTQNGEYEFRLSN